MATKPLLLVDVDGVVSLFGFDPLRRPAGRMALIDGAPHLLSLTAAACLLRLAALYECVWCTGWEDRAQDHLPHLLGLPRTWPYVPIEAARGAGSSLAGHWKLDAIDAYAGHKRPLAWVDDALDDACEAWAEARQGPTLLVGTDPAVGLTERHADALERWQSQLAAPDGRPPAHG